MRSWANPRQEKRLLIPEWAETQKAPKDEQEDDPGAKAPHGNSSDEEDDEVLGAQLRSASQVAVSSREARRQPSEARSDKAAYDEDERRSSAPSTRAVRKEKQRAGKPSDVHSEKGEEPAKKEIQVQAWLEESSERGYKVPKVSRSQRG